MKKKLFFILILVLSIMTYGCIKESYDMERLSEKAEISPTIAVPVFRGTVILSDAIKQSDTVVFDSDKFVRLVFRKDSMIDLKLRDYIDVDNLVSFSKIFTIGEIGISPFQASMGFTLDEISRKMNTVLRNQLVSLDDGATHPFPPLPAVNTDNKSFPSFANFQNAVFSSGFIDITVTNNLPVKLDSIKISLSTSVGPVGNLTLFPVEPGQSQTSTLNLAGKTLNNTLTAAVYLLGSPGSVTPVLIDLDNGITFTANGRDLKVSSGRIIIPAQALTGIGNSDIIGFNPGDDIELDKLKIYTGILNWQATYNASLRATVNLSLPTAIRNSTAVTETINLSQGIAQGNISLPNTVISFNSDPLQPYNKIPLGYTLNINSNNVLIDFHSTDQIKLDLNLKNADFDYIKGFFGQRTESIKEDTLDFGIDEFIRNISGDFFLADPSIKVDYSNSFGVPIEIKFNGMGRKNDESVDLGLEAFTIASPSAPQARDISSTFTVNKNNSSLPELVSLPPESVVFSGSAKMNPAGDPTHLRDNYLYGNSRFLGNVEIELPLELSLTNLQLKDTTDNFLSDDEGSDINSDDIDLAKIGLTLENRFPFDVSVKIGLYDSKTKTVKSTIDLPELLKAAPVDSNGKVNGVTTSTSNIEITNEFFSNINSTDKIIFTFSTNTTDAPKNVKIYSDYGIDFSVSAFVKTDVKFDK
ncbi:MAG TPA: hypothetical protein VHO46_15855 [Bacteroidales bacterium]|nr:hypothetical protein [Bacteroidales bacterium]